MDNRDELIAVWMVAYRMLRRNRENEERRGRLLALRYLLLMQLLQRRNNARGPYCRILDRNDRFMASILRGDERVTRDNLRVTTNSLRRLVDLCGNIVKRSGWTVEFEVMLFLFWLACGAAYRVVGLTFDIPRSTIHRVVHKILNKVVSLLPQIVRLPEENALPEIGMAFAQKAGSAVFRQCVGAIDGCHIRITCPKHLHDQYYNRKQFYSLNLQALVDDSGRFIDIMSGYPGSVHDSRILRNSVLFQQHLYPPEGYFIIGDSGYPCRRHPITLITPFREPLTLDKHAFNRALSKARITVEQSFGMMKVRWRSIFTKALEVKIETSIKVVAACTIMHNICLTQGDIIHPGRAVPKLPPYRIVQDERNGNDLRNLLLQLYTAEQLRQ